MGLKPVTLNAYNSKYARKNRCYIERRSRTNYVRSSIPHSIYVAFNEQSLTNLVQSVTDCHYLTFYSLSTVCQYLTLYSLSTVCQYFTLYSLPIVCQYLTLYNLSTVSQYLTLCSLSALSQYLTLYSLSTVCQ